MIDESWRAMHRDFDATMTRLERDIAKAIRRAEALANGYVLIRVSDQTEGK